jgi:glycosyltransferase involved in cell wall biosynthesis
MATPGPSARPERVSVVVPTRNRAAHAAACAATIVRNPQLADIIFVDQSDDRATEEALAAVHDPRLRYVRSELRGVTNGRNLGIEQSRGDIIAFTDDDCRVPPDWVERIAGVFAADPDAAVVCGRVCVPPEIKEKGFAASFEPEVREWKGKYPPPDRDWGITANLAVRRDVVARVGAFDAMLGVGAPMPSGGEPDFLFRVIRAGYKVVNAREVVLDHLGARKPGPEEKRLLQQYARGTAAAIVKHVRLGDLDASMLYLRHLSGCGRLMLTNALHLRRPLGIGYTLAFLSGTVQSFSYRVDRERRLYLQP